MWRCKPENFCIFFPLTESQIEWVGFVRTFFSKKEGEELGWAVMNQEAKITGWIFLLKIMQKLLGVFTSLNVFSTPNMIEWMLFLLSCFDYNFETIWGECSKKEVCWRVNLSLKPISHLIASCLLSQPHKFNIKEHESAENSNYLCSLLFIIWKLFKSKISRCLFFDHRYVC